MNKRRLHHVWTRLRAVKPLYFLIVALLSLAISVAALRANNEHMIKLRDAVYAADKNNGDTLKALDILQAYVTSHMNTNLSGGPNAVYPPIQLKYTYDRLVQAESDQLAQTNSAFYTTAQHYCEQQDPTDYFGYYRIGCIENYLQTHSTQQQLPTIPADLYEFDFISPKWSPDFAGWGLVVTVLSALLFVVSFIVNRWFKRNT